jgi:hypothetical protein
MRYLLRKRSSNVLQAFKVLGKIHVFVCDKIIKYSLRKILRERLSQYSRSRRILTLKYSHLTSLVAAKVITPSVKSTRGARNYIYVIGWFNLSSQYLIQSNLLTCMVNGVGPNA